MISTKRTTHDRHKTDSQLYGTRRSVRRYSPSAGRTNMHDKRYFPSPSASVFQRMRSIWTSTVISTDTKIRLYKAIVMSVGIYASETWKITTKIAQKLNVFHQRCCARHIYRDHVTNDQRSPDENWLKKIGRYCTAERRFRMAGHILRLASHRPSNVATSWTPDDGRRRRGRPE